MRRAVVHLIVHATAVALVATALAASPAHADPRSDTGPVAYVHPVDAPVVDPFRAPASRFGPGNRGLEYATVAGDEVGAAAPGVVTFAGEVAGTRHVTVRHADARLTSYSFLASVEVRLGDRVDTGTTVGIAGGPVHVSLREDGEYVDPALVFGVEVTSVRLVPENPHGSPLWQEAAREAIALVVLARLEGGGGLGIVGDVVGGAVDGFAGAAGAVGGAAIDALGDAMPALLELALVLGPLALASVTTPLVAAVAFGIVVPVLLGEEPPLLHLMREMNPIAVTSRLVQRTLDWWEQRSNCTPPDVDPPVPSERRVAVLVAGLGTTSDGASVGAVRLDELGYDAGDVVGFSYAGGRTPDAFGAAAGPLSADLASVPVAEYEAVDSTTDLARRGEALADLLTTLADVSPGTTVDLFAHSQGGVVTRLALAELEGRPGGHQVIESLGLVATMGTPHHGADLATLALLAAETGEGAFGLAVADRVLDLPLDPGDATNLVDLAVGSDLLEAASDAGLPDGPAYLSVAARGDMVVLTARSRLDDATNVVVPVDGISSHSALPGDPATTRELALGLAGMPPTCESFIDFVVDTGVAEVLHTGTIATSGAVAQWTLSSVVPDWVGGGVADLLPG